MGKRQTNYEHAQSHKVYAYTARTAIETRSVDIHCRVFIGSHSSGEVRTVIFVLASTPRRSDGLYADLRLQPGAAAELKELSRYSRHLWRQRLGRLATSKMNSR
jgi:hypothetical protein